MLSKKELATVWKYLAFYRKRWKSDSPAFSHLDNILFISSFVYCGNHKPLSTPKYRIHYAYQDTYNRETSKHNEYINYIKIFFEHVLCISEYLIDINQRTESFTDMSLTPMTNLW